jgi:hypothetical protein
MFMSCHQNAGSNHNIKIVTKLLGTKIKIKRTTLLSATNLVALDSVVLHLMSNSMTEHNALY